MVTNNRARTVIAIINSLLFAVLSFFYYYIDIYLSFWFAVIAALVIGASFLLIVIAIISQFVRIFKNRKQLNFGYFLPIIIYFTVLVLPIGSVEDQLSPVKFRACYEGTNSQSVLYFHTDHTFRLHASGIFGYSEWNMGEWRQKADTVLMKWDVEVHPKLGTRLLIDSGYLRPLDASVPEFFRKHPMFYLGYCKGEN